MDTEFTELQVENFGPFIGKHTLPLGTEGVTFIRGQNKVEPRLGANGAGKTKLLNALPWCLYGRTADDLTSTDIRPWKGKGQTRVRVKLISWSGDEGMRHTIERTANPNTFTLNGKPCSVDEIEKLVGWSLPVFRQAIFLGQGQPLFYDLPNREKLEFLVAVLGLARWDKYAERASSLTAKLENQLAGVVGLLSANTVRVEELATQVKLQTEEVNNWEAWRAERLGAAEKQVRALTKRVDKLAADHADISTKFDWAGAELKLTQKEELQHTKKVTEAEITYRTAKSAQIAAKQAHDTATAELADLVKSKRCPTCGGKIARESTYLANKQRIEEAVARFSKEAHGGAVAQAEKVLTSLRAKAQQWSAQVETLQAEALALEAQESLARRNLGEAQLELKGVKRQLEEFEAGVNPHRDRLADLRKVHKTAVADGKAMEKQRTQLEVEAQSTKYWVKGFKDVRLFILEDVLDELEFATNSMLDTMGLVGWEVRYNVERETKSGTTQRGLIITVLNPDKATEAKWKSWSGGEGQRLRLAGALALSQVLLGRAGVECNLEVLDEPTRHLSDEGVEDLCEFLAERASTTGKSIHLVDHKAIENTRFARTVVVVKDKEGSRVVM